MSYFYLLYLGEIQCFIDEQKVDNPNNKTEDTIAERYTVFGELELLTQIPSSVTVKVSSTTGTLFRLSRTHYQEVLMTQQQSA